MTFSSNIQLTFILPERYWIGKHKIRIGSLPSLAYSNNIRTLSMRFQTLSSLRYFWDTIDDNLKKIHQTSESQSSENNDLKNDLLPHRFLKFAFKSGKRKHFTTSRISSSRLYKTLSISSKFVNIQKVVHFGKQMLTDQPTSTILVLLEGKDFPLSISVLKW
jgi:hypothetical protein